ncbi:hypothetical protein Poli38472_007914 [Pythium oligandrum]|uniref:Uncharacterized protein n=1 Tax=Pythium oligandrum TaxID=41045 RepID=A0A8K1CKQ7_PYTOL|nr:hypothetical protein Poli38472_007914 [Pythium oligandrum]|eukprot:TMW65272.1 hypothetical protein Poli38472_007914 [Pythium oligandrum]
MADEINQDNETPVATIQVTEVEPTKSPRDDGRKTLKKQGSSFKEEMRAVLTSLAAGRLPPLTENPPRMTIDPAEEAEMDSTISISTTMVTVSLMLAVGLIIPIFWCLRIDGTVSWSWAVTCIPLWIFDVFICTSPCLVPPTNTDGTPWTLPRQVYSFFTFVLELLTHVFIVKKLETSTGLWRKCLCRTLCITD